MMDDQPLTVLLGQLGIWHHQFYIRLACGLHHRFIWETWPSAHNLSIYGYFSTHDRHRFSVPRQKTDRLSHSRDVSVFFVLRTKHLLCWPFCGYQDLFSVAYSPGEGPVPFVSLAHISLTWPNLTVETGVLRWEHATLRAGPWSAVAILSSFLYVDLTFPGMSTVTAINWFFNFLPAVTFPKFQDAFTYTGAFGYYAAWCVVAWFLILL